MSRAYPTALTLSHAILRVLIALNLLFGLLILGLDRKSVV